MATKDVSIEEARDMAIEYQLAWDELDMGEILEEQNLFKRLAVKFPELRDEFVKNAII